MTLEVGLVTLEAGLVALWRRGLWHCGGGACDTAEAGLVALEAGLVTLWRRGLSPGTVISNSLVAFPSLFPVFLENEINPVSLLEMAAD